MFFHSEFCGEICIFFLNFLLCMGQLQQLQHLCKTILFPYCHIILQVLIFVLKHRNTGIFIIVISIQHSWKHCSVPKEMGETSGKIGKTIISLYWLSSVMTGAKPKHIWQDQQHLRDQDEQVLFDLDLNCS